MPDHPPGSAPAPPGDTFHGLTHDALQRLGREAGFDQRDIVGAAALADEFRVLISGGGRPGRQGPHR